MDPSLVIHQFHPFVEKQPLNVHYQSYEADSAETRNVSWNIDSPFAGALLDNEVYIEYQVSIDGLAFMRPADQTVGGTAKRCDSVHGHDQRLARYGAAAMPDCVMRGVRRSGSADRPRR